MAASAGSGTQGCPTPRRHGPPAPGRGDRPSESRRRPTWLVLGGAREHRGRSSVGHGPRSPPETLGEKDNGTVGSRGSVDLDGIQSMRSWISRSRGRAPEQSVGSLMVGISLSPFKG